MDGNNEESENSDEIVNQFNSYKSDAMENENTTPVVSKQNNRTQLNGSDQGFMPN